MNRSSFNSGAFGGFPSIRDLNIATSFLIGQRPTLGLSKPNYHVVVIKKGNMVTVTDQDNSNVNTAHHASRR